MRTTVDKFGRIVVPKELRDRLGLSPGCEIELEDTADSILMRRVAELPGLVEKEGVMVFSGRLTGDVESAVHDHRRSRIRRKSGTLP